MVIKCTDCNSDNVIKAGFDWKDRKRVQRYRCKNCGKVFVPKDEPPKEYAVIGVKPKDKPPELNRRNKNV